MARMPGARFVGPTENMNKGALLPSNVRGVVVHIAEGYFDGTIAWQKNPSANVSSHFIVDKDGTIAQMVDTSDRAWTQGEGNSTWLSIENVGFGGQSLTPQQVEANAKILLWAHRTFPNVPLQLASSPSGRGLGHHSMGYESGANWGHQFCPGEPIKAQKTGIVALAIALKMDGGTTDMALTKAQDTSLAWAWRILDSILKMKTDADGEDNKFVRAVIEIRDNVKILVGRTPSTPTLALTPADHEAIGKATARALLDMVAGPSAAQGTEAPEPVARVDYTSPDNTPIPPETPDPWFKA